MTEGEIRAIIRQEVRQALAPIMMAVIQSNEDAQRLTATRIKAEGPINNIRNIQPFGVSSRAPKGTEGVAVPVNGDPTHINLLGHFDKTKPEVEDGESSLYDAFGHEVYLSEDKMQFGSKGSDQPMLLGNVVQELFSTILELIANHSHSGNLGYPTGAPLNKAAFQQLKASPVDDGAIKSDKCFTEK